MPKQVLTAAFVSLNSVDLTTCVKSVTINYSADAVDVTTMNAASGNRVKAGGLKDWSITIEFLQDYAAGLVDATLFALMGTTFAFEIRSSVNAVGATNPKYTGTALLSGYSPLSGSVGDAIAAPVTLVAASGLTRAIV